MTSDTLTVVQVSDLHLDPDDDVQCSRFGVVKEKIQDAKPDILVITGDLSADGFLHAGMFERIKERLDGFNVPVHVIPGNHHVGDKPGEKHEIKSEHLDQWKSVFGDDRFCTTRRNWTLIGINTQIVGAGLREEVDQFEWLDTQLDIAERNGYQVAMFLHAAAYLFEPDEVLEGASQYWGFNPYARHELLKRLDHPHVKLVANGHLHWHQVFERDSAVHVWCPSVSFIVDDAIFPRGGGLVGIVRYRLNGTVVEHELIPIDLPADLIPVFRPTLELPGRAPLALAELMLDFTGTLSKDGKLIAGVADRLKALAKRTRITVLTADTFGTAGQVLAGLPINVERIETGVDKALYAQTLGTQNLIAIGNGRNDVAMVKAAAIGIAVVGPEGCNAELLRSADVVVGDINDALDLIANPLRLKATMRE